jgi:hypothetical protein
MNEREHEQCSSIADIVRPLYDFERRLTSSDTPNEIDLRIAYEHYLRDELMMTEAEADLLISSYAKTDVFPSSILFEIGEYTTIVETYRLSLYQEIAPIKGLTLPSRDYEIWTANMLQVMLPPEGRHQNDVCLRTNGVMDDSCEMSVCPVKLLQQRAFSMMEPTFTADTYRVNPMTAYHNELSLLSCIRNRKIITPFEERRIENIYIGAFEKAFPNMVTLADSFS